MLGFQRDEKRRGSKRSLSSWNAAMEYGRRKDKLLELCSVCARRTPGERVCGAALGMCPAAGRIRLPGDMFAEPRSVCVPADAGRRNLQSRTQCVHDSGPGKCRGKMCIRDRDYRGRAASRPPGKRSMGRSQRSGGLCGAAATEPGARPVSLRELRGYKSIKKRLKKRKNSDIIEKRKGEKRMREKIKGFVLGALVTSLVTGLGFAAVAAYQKQETLYYNDIKITLDGEEITPRDGAGNVVDPFIIEGTTYLPVRGISSALGLEAVSYTHLDVYKRQTE